jgi:hypothetical protein
MVGFRAEMQGLALRDCHAGPQSPDDRERTVASYIGRRSEIFNWCAVLPVFDRFQAQKRLSGALPSGRCVQAWASNARAACARSAGLASFSASTGA